MKVIFFQTLLIILFVHLFSCCQNKSYVYKSENEVRSVNNLTGQNRIVFDSFYIPSEKIIGGLGGNYTHCFFWRDTSYLVLEDCENNKVNIYNLNDFSSYSFPFPYSEKMCETSHVFSFLGPRDFYILLGTGGLIVVKDGKSHFAFNINSNEKLLSNGLGIPTFLKYHNEIHAQGDSVLYFPLDIGVDSKGKMYSNANYHFPITGKINLQNQIIGFEGIKYPKFFHENNFGLLNRIYQYYYDKKIIYCFEAIPEIWCYSVEDGSFEKYLSKSSFDKTPCMPITFKRTPETKDLLLNHLKTNPFYHRLIFDPINNIYYRFYALPLDEKSSDGYYTTTMDKRYSVMVLDERFNLLAESLLPSECFFIYFAAPTKDGLCINFGPIINPLNNGIKILRINVEKSIN